MAAIPINAMAKIALPADYGLLDADQRRSVRNEYASLQDGNCAHCNEPLSGEPPPRIKGLRINWRRFPSNFTKYPVHLHHDHATGMTIGAVHSYCNAVLWQYHGE